MILQNQDWNTILYIGAQIRRWRQERGMSIAKLAALVDIDPTYMNKIEKGSNVSIAILCRIASSLNLHPGELLPVYEGTKSPPSAAEGSAQKLVSVQQLKRGGVEKIQIGTSILQL